MNTKPLIYCHNHDVATGNYDCPYAGVVNNSITCSSKECCYNSMHIKFTSSSANAILDYNYCKTHLGAVYGKSVYNLLSNMPDETFPF